MKQTKKLLQKENSLKFPLSAIDRKTIVLLTSFILLLTCTMTGCGSNSQQQSTLPITEPIPIENSAQEESAQEVQNQSVSEQSDMEQPSQVEDNQSQLSSPIQTVPEEAEDETVAPSPDVSSSSPSYLGTWQITSSTFGAFSAMSEEDCSALVGTRFEYFKEYAIYDHEHRLETLGIFKDSIQVVAIENASGIGDTFYIKDENTLIIPWDGVFFEVQRVSSDS